MDIMEDLYTTTFSNNEEFFKKAAAEIESNRAQIAKLKAENERVWVHNCALQVLNENVITERDELTRQLAEYKADAAPEGYVFLSADFSMQAAGHSQFGTVTFIRNKVGRQWWHELPEEQQEITPLYMYGKGTTVIEAMHHAAMKGATE